MSQSTALPPGGGSRTAASVIFDLPGYEVIDADDLPSGRRRIVVQAIDRRGVCPGCGTESDRIHAWVRQRVRDIPPPVGADPVEVVVRKPRLVCQVHDCPRRTFTQVTAQLPTRARCLTRLREHVVAAVVDSGRAVSEVAAAVSLAWATVQAAVTAAAITLPDVDRIRVYRLGIDEHRYARARYFRDDPSGKWRRVEPWKSTLVNLDTGQVLGVVDGRSAAPVTAWLAARSPAWRARVQVVAIDHSAPFRSAITAMLPGARIAVDHWHLVRLANEMVTATRQRVARETLGRRGRKSDLVWAHRMLLLRAGNELSPAATDRLLAVLAADDPTGQIGAAWGVKERLRMLLATTDLTAAATAHAAFEATVTAAAIPEADQLAETIRTWWPQIETFIETRVTNAKTEAANTTIKQIKRTGRGYRNHDNYRTRILLHSARRTRRRHPLTQQGTTLNRE